MKTATLRSLFLLGASALTVAALGAGCDNRHVLGGVGGLGATGGGGGNPGGNPDGAAVIIMGTGGNAQDGAVINPGDAGRDSPEVGVLGPVQSWTGYIENYKFDSGSDAIKIAFASDADGHVVGTVTMGSGTPPPPPTDPNVGYPPGSWYMVGFYFPTIVWEGFGYPMLDATLTGRRLQFRIAYWELWQGWCAIQTPVPGSSSCLPNWGGMVSADGMHCSQRNPDTGEIVTVDCVKFRLCQNMACICDTSACAIHDDGNRVSFDLSITNDLADGSVTLDGVRNLHFTKDP